jgi:hypothetical protein
VIKNTFGISIVPDNDAERLEALREYDLLNSSLEVSINKISELAVRLFKVPIALVALVEEEIVYFKGNVGMEGIESVERGMSLCSLAILKSEVTVFENALEEPCLLANPLVAGTFGLKFYAGAPLKTKGGFNIGTVCIVDTKPRKFLKADRKLLEDLAAIVMEMIELKYASGKAILKQKEMMFQIQDGMKGLKAIRSLSREVKELPYKKITENTEKLLQSWEDFILKESFEKMKLNFESLSFSDLLIKVIKKLRPFTIINETTLKLNAPISAVVKMDSEVLPIAIEDLIMHSLLAGGKGGRIQIDLIELNGNAYVIIRNSGWLLAEEELLNLFLPVSCHLPFHGISDKIIKEASNKQSGKKKLEDKAFNKKKSGEAKTKDLVFVKNCILNHHGRIWAESDQLFSGTKLIVELPLEA